MRQDFAQPTGRQMPLVTRPDFLSMKTLDQLTKDSLNAPTQVG
jgi:hypothetical protein